MTTWIDAETLPAKPGHRLLFEGGIAHPLKAVIRQVEADDNGNPTGNDRHVAAVREERFVPAYTLDGYQGLHIKGAVPQDGRPLFLEAEVVA